MEAFYYYSVFELPIWKQKALNLYVCNIIKTEFIFWGIAATLNGWYGLRNHFRVQIYQTLEV
jgi:hypothetical protein